MKRLCFFILLVVLLAFPSNVRADVAPPIYPPGSNPQPGTDVTQVRMAAETVLIDVQRDIEPESLGWAHVIADFSMHNLGAADENMVVRFPMGGDDGWVGYKEIENLQITVNRNPVQYRKAMYSDINYGRNEITQWAEFDVTFPAGQDVSIRVAYDLQGSGYYPYTAFYYILETGAGWKDTIGSADVILRLPYEANPQNVVTDIGIGWAETTLGGTFQGNEVRWHFEDFEPGQNQPVQNMQFALVAPSMWQSMLTAQANTKQHPNDGEAWGMLGKAYKQIFLMNKGYREDPGGQELYESSVEAYEKCLSLKPDDAQWHAGFADLLASYSMWNIYTRGNSTETFRALNEIHTALELAPNDPVVREIAQNMTYILDGGITQQGDRFDFPWLTQTPTPFPPTLAIVTSDETTATPVPILRDTPQPQATLPLPTPTNVPLVPQKSSPLCGSALLLPLLVMAGIVWKRRQNNWYLLR